MYIILKPNIHIYIYNYNIFFCYKYCGDYEVIFKMSISALSSCIALIINGINSV